MDYRAFELDARSANKMVAAYVADFVATYKTSMTDVRVYVDPLTMYDLLQQLSDGQRFLLAVAENKADNNEISLFVQKVTAEPHFRVYYD